MNKYKCLVLGIVSLLLLFYTSSLHARNNWMSESICKEIMEQAKSIINRELSKIPNKPYFIQKSSTKICQITTAMERINDCVIRSVHGREQAVIFFYDTNLRTNTWTKDIPSTIQKIKIPDFYKGEGECYSADCNEQDIRIGIICRDQEFLTKLIKWLNTIDTDKIINSVIQRYKEYEER